MESLEGDTSSKGVRIAYCMSGDRNKPTSRSVSQLRASDYKEQAGETHGLLFLNRIVGLGFPVPCEELCLCYLGWCHVCSQTISPLRSIFLPVSRRQVVPLVSLNDILGNAPCLFMIGGDQEHRWSVPLVRGKMAPS